MAEEIEGTPLWLKRALLGVCFWMGHRRAMYRGYPLGESAIVAELCNLMFANLPSEKKLLCEVRYRDLFALDDHETDFTERSRVDMCVCAAGKSEGQQLSTVEFAFEVKRGRASSGSILGDIGRLRQLKIARPKVRTFLLLISEQSLPSEFVNENGHANRRRLVLRDGAHGVVRSVMKAVPMLSKLERGHFACAVEVLLPS